MSLVSDHRASLASSCLACTEALSQRPYHRHCSCGLHDTADSSASQALMGCSSSPSSLRRCGSRVWLNSPPPKGSDLCSSAGSGCGSSSSSSSGTAIYSSMQKGRRAVSFSDITRLAPLVDATSQATVSHDAVLQSGVASPATDSQSGVASPATDSAGVLQSNNMPRSASCPYVHGMASADYDLGPTHRTSVEETGHLGG